MLKNVFYRGAAMVLALLVLAAAAPAASAQAVLAQPAAVMTAATPEPEGTPDPGTDPGEAPEEPPEEPPRPSLALNHTAATVKPGKTLQLEATALPAGTVNKGIAWKSSNKTVATVNVKGRVRAFAEGKTTITATHKATGKKAKCTIYVGVPVSKIKLDLKKATLAKGKTQRLSATVTPENAANKKVIWTSSDPDVASVDKNGKVKARQLGQATITATTEDGGRTATFKITVGPAAAGITLSAETLNAKPGQRVRLKATITPSDAVDKTVTWKSSNPAVATVSEKGNVRGIATGKATITATTANGKKAKCTVRVYDGRLFKGRNRVSSPFQSPSRPTHNGIDVVGMDGGTIYATVSGRVRWARMVAQGAPGWGSTWEWGYFVWIEADDGTHHVYAHMAQQPKVKEGKRVQAGQALGVMGDTGYSFGVHVHYEVRRADGRTPMDPTPYAGLENAVGIY